MSDEIWRDTLDNFEEINQKSSDQIKNKLILTMPDKLLCFLLNVGVVIFTNWSNYVSSFLSNIFY